MDTAVSRINELLESGSAEEAQRALDGLAAEAIGPEERKVLSGQILERQGRWEEAATAYQSVLDGHPDHVEAAFRLAYLADRFGDDERAVELYERTTQQTPAHVNALLNLAILYEDAERYDRALDCLERVLEDYPNHARASLFYEDVAAALDMYYDEDQQRLREKRNAILETPVSDFELSVRSRNCLKQMNINTLGDLLKISEAELLAYKNFGETSLNEIKAMLTQKGLRLGQTFEEDEADAAESPWPDAPPGINPAILSRSVAELELSVRSRKCLMRLGVNTIGGLIRRSEAELLAIKNFGMTSLTEIKGRLEEAGLSLRSD